MVESDTIDINVQDENLQISPQPIVPSSSEQRLDNALTSLENFLADQSNRANLQVQEDLERKEVVLANLDNLITHMQEILEQLEAAEQIDGLRE
ncbi:hypothetical protein [Commensalibacter nepenthis]|uniref:Uncharacterized protein n=1 Tax=Commensalibacter nepenthis TaxID=3043872 RepID=A0ABT6Q902_9PROT|nr:hypothetical protein [Commensalibacter sp. TBRC 10068]MDI2113379.1 hypothetical protein [Commensalibacter sp. TBRC 10068]